MKADARAIADAAKAWPKHIRLILLYGQDSAASADHANRIQRGFADPTNPSAVTLLTGAEVDSDPQALVAAVAELSMFGDRTLVRVDGAGEDAAPAVAAVLAATPGNPLIVVAGALKKGSALAALAEKTADALALVSYEPTARDAVALVGGIATENGLRPTQAAARAIFDAAAGDRMVIRQEVEKLALYMDADPAKPQPLDMREVLAVGAGEGDDDYDALVEAVFGRSPAAAAEVARLEARGRIGITALWPLRTRLWLLINLRHAMDGGASAETAVAAARPPLFWKVKDPVTAQLRRWTTPELRAAAHRLMAVERAIKSPKTPGDVLAGEALLGLARGS